MNGIKQLLTEFRKRLLLKKIKGIADACSDVVIVKREMEAAPERSEVRKIWGQRLDDLTTHKLQKNSKDMPFKEMLDEFHAMLGELSGASDFLQNKLTKMAEIHECKTAAEAYWMWGDMISVNLDQAHRFGKLSLILAEEEAKKCVSFSEAKRVTGNRNFPEGDFPHSFWEIWKPYIDELGYQEATVQVPLCLSVDEAEKQMKASWPSEKREKIWKARFIALADEEARNEFSGCESIEVVSQKHRRAIDGTEAKLIWGKRLAELARLKAKAANSKEEAKKLYENAPSGSDAEREYLIRYMELSLAK